MGAMDEVVSASCNRRPEDIRILSIVVAELEFRDVERHVFGAHLVECADYATLDARGRLWRVAWARRAASE